MAIRTFQCILRHLHNEIAAIVHDYLAPIVLTPFLVGLSGHYELCSMITAEQDMIRALEGACFSAHHSIIEMFLRRGARQTSHMIEHLSSVGEPVIDILRLFVNIAGLNGHGGELIREKIAYIAFREGDDELAISSIFKCATRTIFAFADHARHNGRHDLATKIMNIHLVMPTEAYQSARTHP
jgi:hypothetical protein